MDRTAAESLLQVAVNNPQATFRPGQWEAIDALVNHRRRLLVVERTGWGKSLVYFISTHILRARGAGPTLIVSPLLALMRNQIEAAQRLGLCAQTVNSANQDNWPTIRQSILGGAADAILISPERLANEGFVHNVLLPIAARVGLIVVDEAHCISDWGHDFRPDYRRLTGVLRQLPPNVPLLCTTATANDRVIADVGDILGDITVQRGPLVRQSLVLQTLRLPDQASRLAWLAHYVPKLPGTGIIYTLTKDDAERVAGWLSAQGIAARAYYSDAAHPDFATSDAYRQHLEDALLHNRLKALVATNALGMGYDKPDLGFVIHYQAPSSVISYYQQVGRAGRAIDRAYGVLMAGQEDADIQAYFRNSACPAPATVARLLDELGQSDGLTVNDLANRLDERFGRVQQALKVLSVEEPAPVVYDRSKWRRTAVNYQLDVARTERLSRQRYLEWQELQAYVDSPTCLMAFLQRALSDPAPEPCGRCAACRGRPVISEQIDPAQVRAARRFLTLSEFPFVPIERVPEGAFPEYRIEGIIAPQLRAREGRILAHWKDTVWGKRVADGKHNGHFDDELVEALAEMIVQRWQPTPAPGWITCVPSMRHPTLVPDLARRLAARLGLPFVDAIRKVQPNQPQKLQQTSLHQCRNLDGVFAVAQGIPNGPVLLVDDMIDSGWTMTVLAVLLCRAGVGPVFPVALASTTTRE